MKKLKLGQEFEIPESHKDLIQDSFQTIHGCDRGLAVLAEKSHQLQKRVWETIRQLFPELEDYECSYSVETNKVKILNKI